MVVRLNEETIFPASRDKVWRLLAAHQDPSTINRIHSLVKTQRIVSQSPTDIVAERQIDVRGKLMSSTWKVTLRPPELYRWDIVKSEGPWAEGTYIENHYAEDPAGTRMRSTGELKIKVLPFILPQGPVVRKVLDDIYQEDVRFLQANLSA